VPGGAAEKAGVRIGDKVLEINGNSMIGRRHQVAVDAIQQRADGVELLIQRKGEQKTTNTPSNSTTNLSPPSASVPAPRPLPPSLPSASTPTNPSIRTVTPSQLTNTSFSSLPVTTQQQQSKLPYAADLPYGDPKLDGQIEEIHLVRDSKHSLGLSIVGGIDHCSHPFGSSAQPGVFISKITTNSPAELSRRLRIGDRILKVNDADISTAKHNEAVEVGIFKYN
jgi:protein scribble